MKAFAAGCQLALTLLLFSLSVFGQQIPTMANDTRGPLPDPWKTTDEQRDRLQAGMRPEGRVIKTGSFAPAAQDRADYAVFLKQSNTGLIRLLPSQKANERIIRGGGSYYSFHYLSHEYGAGSDLQLVRPLIFWGSVQQPASPDYDLLTVGFGGADYGMLTNLANVPLDDLSLKDPRVQFLAKYAPPVSDPVARCERRRFQSGEMIEGLWYRRMLPVQVGATYLLRSIHYSESDVLVAFRLARRDDDGSVIIAWKLLKEFTPRQLQNVNVKGKCN